MQPKLDKPKQNPPKLERKTSFSFTKSRQGSLDALKAHIANHMLFMPHSSTLSSGLSIEDAGPPSRCVAHLERQERLVTTTAREFEPIWDRLSLDVKKASTLSSQLYATHRGS
ncbi:hypothetical protein D9613_004129 [Agrocybe pediades]|uniref:Uncharacterized protein n=1 Tax=Agrocybe pediades TaxID=84607 RepID=A0A8H4QJP7_9AGAR|nr:hypothetical protein D9613_004129 [Agrocybe pediades]